MSLVLKCDICGKLIDSGDTCRRIERVYVSSTDEIDDAVDDMDICPECWGALIEGIKERKRQNGFSDPWFVKRRD